MHEQNKTFISSEYISQHWNESPDVIDFREGLSKYDDDIQRYRYIHHTKRALRQCQSI